MTAHIGVQVGPNTFYEEGIDHVLDTLRDTCRANAVHVYPLMHHRYSYGSDIGLANPKLADHGKPFPDIDRWNLADVYFHSDPKYYDRPELAPKPWREDMVFAGHDLLDELAEPAARRGMTLHARFCDWGHHVPALPGSHRWCSKRFDGTRKEYYCPRNPDYRRWWESVCEDLFQNKPFLAGMNFGHERNGFLEGALLHGGADADCFCEHCLAEGERRGINLDRVQMGLAALDAWRESLAENVPADGAFVTLMRALWEFPEILAWDRMWVEALFGLDAGMYAAVKNVRPKAQVGWHIFHAMSFSPLFRVRFDYKRMARFADYLKPVIYHDCAGARFCGEVAKLRRTLLADVDEPTGLRLLYALLGYDATQEPSVEELKGEKVPGFSANYCAREVRRCAVAGKPVLAGVGFDINQVNMQPPEGTAKLEAVVKGVFEAGAQGLVLSREYHEMQLENLRAVGRSLDQLGM
ncbi:MAG: hypothetical protein ACFB21_01040 [Opitutales bacterium]